MDKGCNQSFNLSLSIVIAVLLQLFFVVAMHAQVLLPSPYSVEPGDGSYRLSSKTVSVYIGDGVDAPREFLQTDVFEERRVRFVAHQGRADVVLTHAADCLPEAYRLMVTAEHVVIEAADKPGYPVVCSSNYYCYLNFPVTPWKGYAANRTFDLRDVYTNNPSYRAATESNPLVLGMTCALWTDYELTEAMLDQRLFPRILALAEQMWHAGTLQPFDVFYQRAYEMKPWFESHGYTFGPALKEAQGETAK